MTICALMFCTPCVLSVVRIGSVQTLFAVPVTFGDKGRRYMYTYCRRWLKKTNSFIHTNMCFMLLSYSPSVLIVLCIFGSYTVFLLHKIHQNQTKVVCVCACACVGASACACITLSFHCPLLQLAFTSWQGACWCGILLGRGECGTQPFLKSYHSARCNLAAASGHCSGWHTDWWGFEGSSNNAPDWQARQGKIGSGHNWWGIYQCFRYYSRVQKGKLT